MSCCSPGAEAALLLRHERTAGEEVLLASRLVADGVRLSVLSVPSAHCGGCIRKIEQELDGLAGVESARVNLSTRRVTVQWRAESAPPPLVETLKGIGFEAHLFDAEPEGGTGELS